MTRSSDRRLSSRRGRLGFITYKKQQVAIGDKPRKCSKLSIKALQKRSDLQPPCLQGWSLLLGATVNLRTIFSYLIHQTKVPCLVLNIIGLEFSCNSLEMNGLRFFAVRKTGVLNSLSYFLPPLALPFRHNVKNMYFG